MLESVRCMDAVLFGNEYQEGSRWKTKVLVIQIILQNTKNPYYKISNF